MLRNNNFVLRYISDIPCLLTVGQAIADHRHSLRLNSTGVVLWELLETAHTLDELIAEIADRFGMPAGSEELQQLSTDLKEFVHLLREAGAITDNSDESGRPGLSTTDNQAGRLTGSDRNDHRLTAAKGTVTGSTGTEKRHSVVKIAGIKMALYGDSQFFSEQFKPFEDSSAAFETADMRVELVRALPEPRHTATPILQHPDLTVFTENDGYALYFNSAPQLLKAEVNSDASRVRIYLDCEADEELRERLFHAIRMPFLFHALTRGCIMLHSASLLYKNKAWLFSAPSGIGKSTHTGLWKEILEVRLINGDLNLLLPFGEINNVPSAAMQRPLVAGTPWCGTSGIFDTKTYELGGIILLKRGSKNLCKELSPVQKRLGVLNRLISPLWSSEQLDSALTGVNKIADIILICQLYCTIDEAAVQAAREEIDAFLANTPHP